MVKPTGRWTAAKYFLAISFLIFDVMIGIYSIKSTFDSGLRLVRGERVLGTIEQTLSALKDAETGQRGYLLTGDEAHLAPYRKAVPLVEESLDRLESLTPDDPGRHARIGELRREAADRLEELDRTLRVRRDEGPEGALDVLRTDRGRKAMLAVRQILSDLKREQVRLLEIQSARHFESVRRSIHALVIAAVLCVAIIILPRPWHVESPS